MNCTTIEERLDDYVDGELSERDWQAVEDHLQTCLSCNRTLKQLRSLIERAGQLPLEIEPETALWPRIEAQIASPAAAGVTNDDGRRDSSWWSARWRSLAAAAVLLLAISVPFVFRQLDRNPVSRPQLTELEQPAIPGEQVAVLARSEDGVLLPRTDLLETLEMQRGILPIETLSAFEENARLIDQAIAEVRTALDESPGDRRLELQLAARYKQEVALLKRINRV